MSRRNDFFEIFGVLGVIGLIGGGIYCLVGIGTRCDSCTKWFSSYRYKQQIIKTEEAAKDIDRVDKHYDAQHKPKGETIRKERVYGKNITFRNFYECNKCHYKTQTTTVEWRDA